MTAAATTGPARGPRPASSIPATSGIPLVHSSFSNRRLQGMPDAYLSPNDAGCKAFFAFGYATPSDHFREGRPLCRLIFLLVIGDPKMISRTAQSPAATSLLCTRRCTSSVRELSHFVGRSNGAGFSAEYHRTARPDFEMDTLNRRRNTLLAGAALVSFA